MARARCTIAAAERTRNYSSWRSAATARGGGLRRRPFAGEVESSFWVEGGGRVHLGSRRENAELFKRAMGGYGLFGVISSVPLRLDARRKIERAVEVIRIDDLMPM